MIDESNFLSVILKAKKIGVHKDLDGLASLAMILRVRDKYGITDRPMIYFLDEYTVLKSSKMINGKNKFDMIIDLPTTSEIATLIMDHHTITKESLSNQGKYHMVDDVNGLPKLIYEYLPSSVTDDSIFQSLSDVRYIDGIIPYPKCLKGVDLLISFYSNTRNLQKLIDITNKLATYGIDIVNRNDVKLQNDLEQIQKWEPFYRNVMEYLHLFISNNQINVLIIDFRKIVSDNKILRVIFSPSKIMEDIQEHDFLFVMFIYWYNESRGLIKISIRTFRDDIHLGEILENFGGGGEQKAAGIVLRYDKLEEFLENLISYVENMSNVTIRERYIEVDKIVEGKV